MLQKKGVSPLIATVLLLAFAVALATVIIQLRPFDNCNVQLDKLNGKQRVCYNEQTKEIELFIDNKDSNSIAKFKTTASGERNAVNSEYDLSIGPREQGKLMISYDPAKYGRLVKLSVYPIMNVSGKLQECDLNEEIASIPICP
jgi:flagellin-like protein